MNIIVFDIDGTLTHTNRVDGRCLAGAIGEVMPDRVPASFADFPEMTDSAILREICSDFDATESREIESRVRDAFVARLEIARAEDASDFSAVRGAPTVFDAVRSAGWTPAIATGGWRPSAEFKLHAAGISFEGIASATASEHRARTQIIQQAVQDTTRGATPTTVIYVGDGTWDIKACRELGIGFIGRAEGAALQRLTGFGARAVLADFASAESLVALLAEPRTLDLAVGSGPVMRGSIGPQT